MKKIAIIGAGTAGCVSALHFLDDKNWINAMQLPDKTSVEIDWYHDPNIKPQPVGEGSTLRFSSLLHSKLGLTWDDLDKIDGTAKNGIMYHNWGNKDFLHYFELSSSALHFNASKFQQYTKDRLNPIVNIIEANVTNDQVDADYVIDCSGRPKTITDDFHVPEYIPVNAAHVTQCYWDTPRFFHTKTVARPYGWVFMVPLVNRCSVGYLYNHNINSLAEVQEDVQEIFQQWDLTPSTDTNSFHYDNYYKKTPVDGRVVYNGNSCFFLEPMEATSIDSTIQILHKAMHTPQTANEDIMRWFRECEYVIMIHYAAGSKWKNSFWEFAQDRGRKCIENADPHIKNIVEKCSQDYWDGVYYPLPRFLQEVTDIAIGPWQIANLKQNLEGLDLNE